MVGHLEFLKLGQMKQKINATIFFFIISIFFKASFLFAQTQTNTITIHQEITFNASPGRIYQILLSSKEFNKDKDCRS
jgi:hypothetical protein